MTRKLSIGLRLTLYYTGILALSMSLIGLVAVGGMWRSIRSTVNEQLKDKMAGVRMLMTSAKPGEGEAMLRARLDAHSQLETQETFLQIWSEDGGWLYRSLWLQKHPMPVRIRTERGRPYGELNIGEMPVRVAVERIPIDGREYIVEIAEPIDDYRDMLKHFEGLMALAIPLLLALAAGGGYWLSRRALAPVDELTTAAKSIHARNLSQRLRVSEAQDELSRLAETLNAMLDRIEAAMRRITQFTADASHELRTPIALMRTRAEISLRHPRTAEESRRTIELMHDELLRASGLIEHLMMMARADASTIEATLADCDLVALCRDACAQIEVAADARQTQLLACLPNERIIVHADARLMRQLLIILLDNAVKYTPNGGTVQLSLSRTERGVEVSVLDTGVGVDEEDLSHIFERFYRADKARSREMGGAGLGLSIARWIAEQHGCQLTAESTPGEGSIFHLFFPCEQ